MCKETRAVGLIVLLLVLTVTAHVAAAEQKQPAKVDPTDSAAAVRTLLPESFRSLEKATGCVSTK